MPNLCDVHRAGGVVMKATIRAGCVALVCALLPSVKMAVAQSTDVGCSSENSTNGTQTLHCEGGVTIVAENGAQYVLRRHSGNRRVDSAELNSKALLIEIQKKPVGSKFQVITPQAIAAVRGTKWA